MNTHIQELMKQAMVEHQFDLRFSPEKFAELIVLECAQIADKAWAAPGYQIKQHFGVAQ
jgi:hypothetical protein